MSRSCRMLSPAGAPPVTRWYFSRALPADRRAWLLFLRFGVVGLLNTAFGYAVFAALVLVGVWTSAALVAATTAGVAFNFQTSRRLVFRSDGHGQGRRLRFVAIYGAVLALNWAVLRMLLGFGIPELQAQALLAIPLAAVSFLGQRAFVFGPAAGQA